MRSCAANAPAAPARDEKEAGVKQALPLLRPEVRTQTAASVTMPVRSSIIKLSPSAATRYLRFHSGTIGSEAMY